ncbi:DUF2490 domain-containing protein [Flavisphingomonas formosensis]|uniref:DUF2490 domain-containing protein n=1 Tax=Flavisphingomonas formosensis TaxID=861534 RepID=UPI0012FC3266|nr:DUF2490 domain-containing protein [Sphingomonas formosensis]
MTLARSTRLLLPALVLSSLLALPGPARAETEHDGQAWVNLTVMGSLSGPLLYFGEVQPRFDENGSRIGTAIFRGAIGWKLSSSLSLYQGYGHIVSPVKGGRDIVENRGFQQLNWIIGHPAKGELSSRTRLEQRWRSDGSDIGWRLRQMLRYERPLVAERGLNLLGHGEAFVAFNDTDWGARAGFDQLRSFAGVEIALPGKSTIELGYLNQYIDRGGGRHRVNHAASFSLFIRP